MKKRIVIIGLGAVGSVLTATLLENPINKIHNIVKTRHLSLLKSKQLNFYGKERKTYPIEISNQINFPLDNTLIIPMVKLYDLRSVIREIKDKITPSTKLLILTNGINIRERILHWSANKIPLDQMFRGIIGFGATMKSIGHIKYFDGKIIFEEKFTKSNYYPAFKNSFIDLRITSNIKKLLWKKLLINSIFNPLSLILRIPNNTISLTELNHLKEPILTEGLQVARSDGIKIKFALEELNSLVSSDNITSMYQDFLFNKKTEIDYLNGEIVKIGTKNKIPVPINKFMVSLIKSFEFIRNNKLSS